MSVAVIRFWGSNCDRDTLHVLQNVVHQSACLVSQDETALAQDVRAVILPGGFSFGDYLRCGAMAAHTPIMPAVRRFAEQGGPVLGICNGFQILCEAGLLPGALLPNAQGRFVCTTAQLEVASTKSFFLHNYAQDAHIKMPIAHHDGRYVADAETLLKLQEEGRIALRYAERDPNGNASINGSSWGIAGITGGVDHNILGLMPHPERCSEQRLGGEDGLGIFKALLS